MAPYDVKRERKALYAPKNTGWDLVEVPAQRFLAVDGTGNPDSAPAYAHAVEALYGVAYTLKFAAKRAGERDFVVGPLEGLWWADRWDAFTARAKDLWHWTMLIALPPWTGAEPVEEAKAAASARRKQPAIARVRVLALDEGLCAQVLHTGPYDDEGPVPADLHERYLPAHGLRPTGRHHEIHLSDPRRTAPGKLRTVLRQPVDRLPQP